MEKLIVTPDHVRGHGNILEKNKEITSSNIFSEWATADSEIIDGIEYPVIKLSYKNSLLYFTQYPNKTTPNFPETFKGIVKDENNDVIANATIKLIDNGLIVASSTSNNEGIVTFTNVTFSTGRHIVQLSYNDVKSGKLVLESINPDNILVEDIWITRNNTISFNARIEESDHSVKDVPVKMIVGEDTYIEYTDSQGLASFELTGKGYNSTLQIQCGTVTEDVDVHDSILYMREGETNLSSDFRTAQNILSNATCEWQSNGFKLTPQYSGVDVTTGQPTNPVTSHYFHELHEYDDGVITGEGYLFPSAIVEFTYKGGTGYYPINLRAWKNYNLDYIVEFYYSGTYNEFILHAVQNGVLETYHLGGNLVSGDNWKLIFFEGNIKIYRNNVLFHSNFYDEQDLIFGFRVSSSSTSIYDNFNIQNVPPDFDLPVPDNLSLSTNKSVMVKNTSVSLSCNVLTAGGNPVEGETITFYNGASSIGSAITNSNGVATLNYTPTSATTLSLTAKSTNNKTSNSVSVRVKNNNTPTSIVVSASETSVSVGTDVTLTVTVKDSDNDPVPNAKIVLGNGSDYVTCDGNGEYTTTVAMLSASTVSFTYKSYDYPSVVSNTVSVTWVAAATVSSVSLTADKSILSYADGDSCTLTATVLDTNNQPVAGKTVSFDIVSNGSVVSNVGSAVTDGSGVATVSYSAQGTGDLNIQSSVGSILSQTYGIEDCTLYDNASSNKISSNYGSNMSLRNSGAGTLSYDSTNLNYDIVVSTTGESFFPITSATGLTDFTVEFDTYFVSQNSDVLNGLIVYKDSNNWYRVGYMPHSTRKRSIGDMNGGTWNETSSNVSSFPLATWIHYKATISNGTLSVTLSYNGTTYDTYSVSVSSLLDSSTKYGFVSVWASGRHAPFKNLKIKPL